MANCLGLVGRQNSQPWMVQEGLRIYGQALKRLSLSLQNPAYAQSDGLLVIPIMLSLFEVSDSTSEAGDSSWLNCAATGWGGSAPAVHAVPGLV